MQRLRDPRTAAEQHVKDNHRSQKFLSCGPKTACVWFQRFLIMCSTHRLVLMGTIAVLSLCSVRLIMKTSIVSTSRNADREIMVKVASGRRPPTIDYSHLQATLLGKLDMEEAGQLAEKCLPALQTKGISNINIVTSVQTDKLLTLWTGEGSITKVTMQGGDGSTCSFVAKSIGTYKKCDAMQLQDHWSYYNEMSFYESDLPDRMFQAGLLCPRPLFVDRISSGLPALEMSSRMQDILRRFRVEPNDGGEEKDVGVMCMTVLNGSRWKPSGEQIRGVLTWLARLHALFWGNERANAAVSAGVSDQAGFWHFDNRQIEFTRMSPTSPLKLAAAAIDERMKADAMQTMCHGDPKSANIMWDKYQGVLMYDFQWFGKAPPTKDLAYFFATAAMNHGSWDKAEEQELLHYYHKELCTLLEAQGDKVPTFEYLFDSYRLAVVDYGRWVEGGFSWGNEAMIDGHAKAFFKALTLGGRRLMSEADFRKRVFEVFPP